MTATVCRSIYELDIGLDNMRVHINESTDSNGLERSNHLLVAFANRPDRLDDACRHDTARHPYGGAQSNNCRHW